MSETLNIEELLNSYIDGELTIRQRTQVKRMVYNDPKIAQRLEQLKSCRQFMNSLPVVPAPSGIMQNVMAKMTAQQLLEPEPVVIDYQSVKRNILSQKVIAIAATIVLVSLLTIVFNTLTLQTTTPTQFENNMPNSFATVVGSNTDLVGRLEMKTNDLAAFNGFMNRCMADNGLSDSFELVSRQNSRYVYQLSCSKERLSGVMDDLGTFWDRLDTASLSIDMGFGQQVAVNGITNDQIKRVVSQEDLAGSIEVAKDIAVSNGISDNLAGREIVSPIDIQTGFLRPFPMPVLTQDSNNESKNLDSEAQEEKTVRLTIVLSR